ncbi:uncharacterized protein RJT20DRAFT_15265 [Scheffersomyces xylosifermentans]|uniref:uncharacterized protein n=1 Tax=Scheffersomyces xylosifermentans TaxID=1304137 RepID=UPI00315D1223
MRVDLVLCLYLQLLTVVVLALHDDQKILTITSDVVSGIHEEYTSSHSNLDNGFISAPNDASHEDHIYMKNNSREARFESSANESILILEAHNKSSVLGELKIQEVRDEQPFNSFINKIGGKIAYLFGYCWRPCSTRRTLVINEISSPYFLIQIKDNNGQGCDESRQLSLLTHAIEECLEKYSTLGGEWCVNKTTESDFEAYVSIGFNEAFRANMCNDNGAYSFGREI